MSRKPKVTIEAVNNLVGLNIKIELSHSINIVVGDSGTGKSALVRDLSEEGTNLTIKDDNGNDIEAYFVRDFIHAEYAEFHMRRVKTPTLYIVDNVKGFYKNFDFEDISNGDSGIYLLYIGRDLERVMNADDYSDKGLYVAEMNEDEMIVSLKEISYAEKVRKTTNVSVKNNNREVPQFRVIVGIPLDDRAKWLRCQIGDSFSYGARVEWFADSIVREELLDVDGIVDINGFCLKKKNGRVISPDWLSQGSRQFLMMTQRNTSIYDSCLFGRNVFPYFYRWADERNTSVTVVASEPELWWCDELRGTVLNTGEQFNSGEELDKLILENKNTVLGSLENGKLWARKFRVDSEDNAEYYGDQFYIDVGSIGDSK